MEQRARSSCFSCRRSKRRCDKTLPACRLCDRRDVVCSYPRRRGQTSPSPVPKGGAPDGTPGSRSAAMARVSSAASLPGRGPGGAPESFALATAIRFMAPDLFSDARLEVSRLDLAVPPEVALSLGDGSDMRDAAVEFFKITRSWLPIVNRQQHVSSVLSPLLPDRRPTALLALCMKLLTLRAGDGKTAERLSLYRLAKEFYAEVESTSAMCIQVLQAAVIIAVFEIGDAIYPAAYLTVGGCARYGMAMGLDRVNKERMGGFKSTVPWIEIEEMRRAWWAVLVLDRFLNMSDPCRSLVTEDPLFDDFLPVDDARFNSGETQPEDATPVCEAFSLEVGQFSRLCQATHLLSKTLAMIKSLPTDPGGADVTDFATETAQLRRTLEALVRTSEKEVTIRRLAFCCLSIVSYSSVLLLQQHYWEQIKGPTTAEVIEKHTFEETYYAFETLCRISRTLQEEESKYLVGGGECTFFLADVIYRASMALVTLGQGTPSGELKSRMAALKWLMRRLQPRWPLTAVHEAILDTKEALLAAKAL